VTATAVGEEGLPVLFVYIGWATRYDGTEDIEGNFEWIKGHPKKNWEVGAFAKDPATRTFRCGLGKGRLPAGRLNVVFVARRRAERHRRVVGVYLSARAVFEDGVQWAIVDRADLFPPERRPLLRFWPGDTGVRRWARRFEGDDDCEYPELLRLFRRLVKNRQSLKKGRSAATEDQELAAFEGDERRYFVAHRHREQSKRQEKIAEIRSANKGRVLCQVPGCRFDFQRIYGKLGDGYAEVHHLKPLRNRTKTLLKDLAVVCANCHRMIHRYGQCRKLDGLGVQA
jgi:5-methylcytosine-specific restriction endonuclease McrA